VDWSRTGRTIVRWVKLDCCCLRYVNSMRCMYIRDSAGFCGHRSSHPTSLRVVNLILPYHLRLLPYHLHKNPSLRDRSGTVAMEDGESERPRAVAECCCLPTNVYSGYLVADI
jgi:hypothetical protein